MPLPPVALSVEVYGSPATPLETFKVVMVSVGYTMVRARVPVATFPAPSFTVTTKVPAFSPAVGVPVMAPVGDRLSPTALKPVPEMTAKV